VNAYDDPNQPVELGASIFVEVNAILQNTSLLLGLNSTDSETETSELLGIWNSEKFVFTQKEGSWAWLDIAKLIWKYGLSPIRTQRLMKSVVGKFLKLYEHPAFPFRSLSERAHDLDLVSVTSVTGDQFLSANGVSDSKILSRYMLKLV
jgi:prenylcysteine oxidase/farnesylcysteine lyase